MGLVTQTCKIASCAAAPDHFSRMGEGLAWTPVPEQDRTGVVTYNYSVQRDTHLQAFIGDRLHIFEECQVARLSPSS